MEAFKYIVSCEFKEKKHLIEVNIINCGNLKDCVKNIMVMLAIDIHDFDTGRHKLDEIKVKGMCLNWSEIHDRVVRREYLDVARSVSMTA